MRVCFFGLYDSDYLRNAILRAGLELAGVEVIDCREPLVRGATPSLLPIGRSLALRGRLRAERATVDAVYLPEFNQAIAPLARSIIGHRVPLVVDFLVSLYDTAVNDRGQSRVHVRPHLLRLGDMAALRAADAVITDTSSHSAFYSKLYGARHAVKMRAIHVGAPDWAFATSPLPDRPSNRLNVLFYGSFIPLHGVEYVITAAQALRDDERFRFVIVGSGQTYPAVRTMYDAMPSGNVEFRPSVPQRDLPQLLDAADICLGTFGSTDKAQRVIPNKVWQGLAAARPLITAANEATRGVFTDGQHCLLVPRADPRAIVNALQLVADDWGLARRLGAQGAALVRQRYTSAQLGAELLAAIVERSPDRRARR